MEKLLRDEIALVNCYNATDRNGAIVAMQEALPHMEDELATVLMMECISKLGRMSDVEFTVAMHMGMRLVEELFI